MRAAVLYYLVQAWTADPYRRAARNRRAGRDPDGKATSSTPTRPGADDDR